MDHAARARLRFAAALAASGAALGAVSLLLRRRRRRAEESEPWELDVRSGVTTRADPAAPPKNWAFLSCGRVAHDYANALKCVDGAALYVVATRSAADLPRAEAFRDLHGFQKAAGSYAEALADPAVDVVYLSAMHSARVAHVTQILEAGKACVVEKPLACSAADGARLVKLAREKGVFMMEGMWTRCFPAVEKARKAIDDGVVGAVTAVISDFGFDAADSGAYPVDASDPKSGDPIYHASLGGGALLWAGPYPLAAGTLPFGATAPLRVAAAGVADPSTGIDLSCGLTLSYSKPGGPATASKEGSCPPRGATVSVYTSIDAETRETTTYVGQKGRVIVLPPAHCPTCLRIELKGAGRGAADATEETFAFPPPKRPFAKTPGGDFFYYPNSHGFAYEAAAVTRCLYAGLAECPQFTLDESLRVLALIDAGKEAVGAKKRELPSAPSVTSTFVDALFS